MAACSPICMYIYLYLNYIELKIRFISLTSHILSGRWLLCWTAWTLEHGLIAESSITSLTPGSNNIKKHVEGEKSSTQSS